MGQELARRGGPPAWVRLEPGQEWWEDNPHRLAARVGTDRAVEELGRWELAPGVHGSLVRRLKPRPPAWRKPVVLSATGTAAAVVVLWVLYVLVSSLVKALVAMAPLLAAFAVAWVLLRWATGHRAACAGLHCPGCRG